jgi:cold shock CspA family protein
MPIGTLFSWFSDRGYGFLEPDNGNRDRSFVHITEMNRAGIKRPIVGTPFEWEVGRRNGKPCAVNVEPLMSAKFKEDEVDDGDKNEDDNYPEHYIG